MIGRLLGQEEVHAALVLALSGALMALVANGDGPLSLGRILTGVLSDPVPKEATGTSGDASVPNPDRQIAA
jgi:hypothetical protein